MPGYHGGTAPYGVWAVAEVFVDPAWLSDQDPHHDVAILRLARQQYGGHRVGVQNVVGGNVLGAAPRPGTVVQVPAYPIGINDDPINCRNRTYLTRGYPSFDCHFYFDATSGAPFLRAGDDSGGQVVVGVIGGLHQGGCVDYTSYAAPFGADIRSLLTRAGRGQHPDALPVPGSSGC